MNEREQILVRAVTNRLSQLGRPLIEEGWQVELIVFAPTEIERLPGFKVALVVPIGMGPT